MQELTNILMLMSKTLNILWLFLYR